MMTLDEIALALHPFTDKDSRRHGYTRIYDEIFSCRRADPISLLEIGIWEGASLEMWRRYFPFGAIYGLDLNTEALSRFHPRIQVFKGSQTDGEKLFSIAQRAKGFDIIIDDASHVPSDQYISFEMLWPRLRDNGWYVIEDLHMHWQHPATTLNIIPNLITELACLLCHNGKTTWADLDNASADELKNVETRAREIAQVIIRPCLLMVQKGHTHYGD